MSNVTEMQDEPIIFIECNAKDEIQAFELGSIRTLWVAGQPPDTPRLIANINARIINARLIKGLGVVLDIAGWDATNTPFLLRITRVDFWEDKLAQVLWDLRGPDAATMPGMEGELTNAVYLLSIHSVNVERSNLRLPSFQDRPLIQSPFVNVVGTENMSSLSA